MAQATTLHIINWFKTDKLYFHQNNFQYLKLGLIQNTERRSVLLLCLHIKSKLNWKFLIDKI